MTYKCLGWTIGCYLAAHSIDGLSREVLISEVSEQASFDLVLIQDNLRSPSSLAFVGEDTLLITGWHGELWRVSIDDPSLGSISFAPSLTEDGGLRTVTPHPDFERNGLLYFCHATGTVERNETHVSRGRLVDDQIVELVSIFAAGNFARGTVHQGCIIVWDSQSTFLLTLGDRRHHADRAQSVADYYGVVVRLDQDGQPVETALNRSNPASRRGIYSFGHRNIQGMALDSGTDEVWAHEHGPFGGDEVNVLYEGRNYGWPIATFGIDYDGTILTETPILENVEAPIFYWYPSIAPSGLTIYQGKSFPKWRGDLLLGGLMSQRLHRMERHAGRVIREELLLGDLAARIRDVKVAPGGDVYLLTDEQKGRLLALVPRSTARE